MVCYFQFRDHNPEFKCCFFANWLTICDCFVFASYMVHKKMVLLYRIKMHTTQLGKAMFCPYKATAVGDLVVSPTSASTWVWPNKRFLLKWRNCDIAVISVLIYVTQSNSLVVTFIYYLTKHASNPIQVLAKKVLQWKCLEHHNSSTQMKLSLCVPGE